MGKIIIRLLSVVFLLTACTKAGTPNDYLGMYNLVKVDGNPLPYTQPPGDIEYLAGILILNEDGTCQWSRTLNLLSEKSISDNTKTGTYSFIDDITLYFEWESGDVTLGTLDSNTVTLQKSFVFQK